MNRYKWAALISIAATMSLVAEARSEGASPASLDEAIAAGRTSLGTGYLTPQAVPDSSVMLPPPPAPGSAALARDEEAAKIALALRGGPRWVQAMTDADIIAPASTSVMSCAAGFAIGEKETPAIQKLLRRSMADLGLSGSAAKRRYARSRPFMVNGEPSCTPDWEPMLRKDGSYPSGHSAIGYGWGLILAEIVPGRAARLVARGRAFGDSRRVCNVHWLSDVEEGRITASAVVARLHAEPAFQKDLKAARAEVRKFRTQGTAAACAAEVAAPDPIQ